MLDEKIQPEIVKRINYDTNSSTRCVKRFRASYAKKFANTSLRASQVGGIKAAAQIMNFMKGEDEQKIFKEVAKVQQEFND